MKTLDDVILSFDDWTHPWTFNEFVINSTSLTAQDKSYFNQIWTAAVDSHNWKNADLGLCSEIARNRLIKEFSIVDKVTENIVRAAAYQWR